MPQYVVRLMHTSDQCPISNSKIRNLMLKSGQEMPALAQKIGVKMIFGPLVLGSEHTSLALVEADKIETVDELILQSGMLQWNTVHVSPAKTMEQAIKDLERSPPPVY